MPFTVGGGADSGLEGPGHRKGGAPVCFVEPGVAARQGEAVGLAHGRTADHLDAEVEVGAQTTHDRQLLEVLLAEHREVGADGGEELGDDGGDTVEVAGARRAFHHRRPARRSCTVVW